MRLSVVTLGLFAVLSVAQAATACPTSGEVQRPVRPVQNVSFQASELFERAQEFENAASERDRSAVQRVRQADALLERARTLRNQAGFINVADRPSVLAVADDLVARASTERALADDDRGQASQLRAEARALRDRAAQLVRGGNGTGWRKRPPMRPTAETNI